MPGAGWVGFDPTSGLLATEGHIPLACAPDPSDASPINGSVEPSKVDFSFDMSINRISDHPNAAAPYSEEQWSHVRELAHAGRCRAFGKDVRLTIGGEPTFVGIDEPDSPQWNGDALGPLKRNRAITLIRRIQEVMAPGALLHFGQGKWYPGEALPRWALNCYWRADGVPVWENFRLIARNLATMDSTPLMRWSLSKLSPDACKCPPRTSCRLTRTRSTTCGRNGDFL